MYFEEFRKLVEYQSLWDLYNKKIDTTKTYHTLLECDTDRILVASRSVETIKILADLHINCYVRYDSNLFLKPMPIEFNPRTPFYTKLDRKIITCFCENVDLTFNELYNYCLLVEKACLLDLLTFRINFYRRSVFTELRMQESIYNYKIQEAKEIIESETLDDDADLKWPFVRDYANIYDLDLYSAAKNILIQNKFYKTELNKSESLRLRIKDLVKECDDITKIKSIYVKLVDEGGIYGQL